MRASSLLSMAMFFAMPACEHVVVEQVVVSLDGGRPIASDDQLPTTISDMSKAAPVSDMAQAAASDMANANTGTDMAPMCGARLSSCIKTDECCSGLMCDTNNDTCCIPGAGSSTAGCDYVHNTGCCNVNIGANAGVTCQNQAGVGVCCRNIGGVCATDQDCCLQNTGTMVLCINNTCTAP